MALFDFIGSGPDQLSLSEVLSALPAVAGPVLMARGRKLGLPIGMGLTAFGNLGQELAKKSGQYNQQVGQAEALKSLMPMANQQSAGTGATLSSLGINTTPNFAEFLSQWVKAGGKASDAATIFKTMGTSAKPMFRMGAGGQEEAFDPASGQTLYQMGKGDYTSSFKPESAKGKGTFAEFQAAHPELSIDQQIERYKALGEKPAQPNWRNVETGTGAVIQEPYKYNPATGKMEKVPVEGEPSGGIPAKLNAQQQKQVDSIREVENSLPVLHQYVAALPQNLSPAMMAREYAKYRAPFGALGQTSKAFTDYFDMLGQMQTSLIAARIGGLSRSQQIINALRPHIPEPTDPPTRAMQKMEAFQKGAFDSTLATLLQNTAGGAPTTEPSATPGSPPPAPPFQVNKTYFKDGQWYVSDPSGKFFQFDGTKWAPL